MNNLWAQIPFCGSLILPLPAVSQRDYEKELFRVSEIPELIDFIKETGRLQIALSANPLSYVGLDFLDPFFNELRPPYLAGAPYHIFGTQKEVKQIIASFHTLGKIKFIEFFDKLCANRVSSEAFLDALDKLSTAYSFLKLRHYEVVEDIENCMIDNPEKTLELLTIYRKFITDRARDLRSDLTNFSLEDSKEIDIIPSTHELGEIRFPLEIGKFLLKKLTYAPQDIRACYNIVDHYDSYDLQIVLKSLNDGILTTNPDLLKTSVNDLNEILNNVWDDKTIPRLIRGLEVGITLSIAAIGYIVAGPIGAIGGFLAELGFEVASELIDVGKKDFSEKVVKLRMRNYQSNVYDFKKKYKNRIVH